MIHVTLCDGVTTIYKGVEEHLERAPSLIIYEGGYYTFFRWESDRAIYYKQMPWFIAKPEPVKEKKMPELDKARLEDDNGQLLHIISLDSTSGAPRVLIFKNKCWQFVNYGSTLHVPTYRVVQFEMIPDSAEVKSNA